MMTLKNAVWVFLACGSGGLVRFAVQSACSVWMPLAWQGWATVLSNGLACFLAGFLSGVLAAGSNLRLALLTGFCGGLSTFSAFALDYLPLVREGQWAGWLYMLAQVLFGLALAWLGLALGESMRTIA